MANPIYATKTKSSFKTYVSQAIKNLEGNSEIVLIEKKTGGDPFIYNLKKNSKVNSEAIKNLKKFLEDLNNTIKSKYIDEKEYKAKLDSIKIEVEEKLNWKPSVANIMKHKEKINFGYLAEVILQAAIVARFVTKRDKTDRVNEQDVIKYLNEFISAKLDSSKSKAINKTIEYPAPNLHITGKDIVIASYSLYDAAYKWLEKKLQEKNYSEIKPYINDATSYVNSSACKDHSYYFYTNRRVDKIDIKSVGISGQKETKADIKTQYYENWPENDSIPHELNLNLSVKVNGIEQVGQITGIDSKTYKALVECFGGKLSAKDISAIDDYASVILSKNVTLDYEKKKKDAQSKIYEIVYSNLSEIRDAGKLLDGLEHFMALGEAKSLTIIDLGSGLKQYFVKNLERLKVQYSKKRVIAEVSPKNNSIKFMLDSNSDENVVLKIQSRETGDIFRNYVLTGPLTRNFLAQKEL